MAIILHEPCTVSRARWKGNVISESYSFQTRLLSFQGLFVPRVGGWADATGAISSRCPRGSR